MTDTQSSVRPATDVRRAWTIGGALLIAATLSESIWLPGAAPFAGGIITVALLAASLLVFAFGIGGSGSVTGSRPLGTTALAGLAIWLLGTHIAWQLAFAANTVPTMAQQLMYTDALVGFALAAIAVVQIARVGVVPRPWNWAPVWVVAALAGVWLLTQLIFVNIGGGRGPNPDAQTIALFLGSLDSFVRATGPVFLGVVAIVLGDRSATARPERRTH